MPQKYTIQKLKIPLTGGQNLIFRVEYFADSTLPQEIEIYHDSNIIYTLKDDGNFPDINANDFIYSTYSTDSIPALLNKIDILESKMIADSQLLHFTGHVGKSVKIVDFIFFNKPAFNNFEEVPLNAFLVDLITCNDNLLKENSLLITDLSVVEDINRTFNPVNATLNQQNFGIPGWTILPEGNDEGVWTFGQLMMNITNTPSTSVSVKDFLKAWVKTIRLDEETAMKQFIGPWISRARGLVSSIPVTINNQAANYWETEWDNALTTEAGLIKNAPFKLTAIVNRIDLRQNAAYNQNMSNSGETRFIFTMVNPFTGTIPILFDNDFTSQNFIDWKGFNVIFEYGNVQTNLCDLQNFGLQWYNLSTLTLGSNDYLDALELITNSVTLPNAVPSKPNGSAINRIRTNEKCFSGITPGNNGWAAADWQLRQMELNAGSHLFELVPVTNVPISDPINFNDANAAVNIGRNGTESQNIIDWAYSSPVIKNRIRLGNFNIPNTFNNNNLLANIAHLEKELVDIFGFNYAGIPNYNINNASLETKEIENQLSLNTCQGCHGGNNKTIFTQVRPATYGQEAKYWTATPDVASAADGFFDNRFFGPFYNTYTTALGLQVGNRGITFDNYLNNGVKNVYLSNVASGPFQMVSPFLTGRRYSGGNNWEDDELDENGNMIIDTDAINDPNAWDDNLQTGVFYVNDPHNDNTIASQLDGYFPKLHDQKWGFNDLERRKKDLCNLLDMNCATGFAAIPANTIQLLQLIGFIPFPLGGH